MPPVVVLDAGRSASSRPTRLRARGHPRPGTRRRRGTARRSPGRRCSPPGARGRRRGTSSWSSRGTRHGCATVPHERQPARPAMRARGRHGRRRLEPRRQPGRRAGGHGDLRRARRLPPVPSTRSAGRQGVGRMPAPCRTSRRGEVRTSRPEHALAVLAGGGPPMPPEGPHRSPVPS